MEYNYKKLRGRIKEMFDTESKFAEIVGISRTQMSNKLNGKAGFDQEDIILWCNKLNIQIEEVGVYFFT